MFKWWETFCCIKNKVFRLGCNDITAAHFKYYYDFINHVFFEPYHREALKPKHPDHVHNPAVWPEKLSPSLTIFHSSEREKMHEIQNLTSRKAVLHHIESIVCFGDSFIHTAGSKGSNMYPRLGEDCLWRLFFQRLCIGCTSQGFGGRGATAVGYVRRCQHLPPCPIEPVPAGFKTDLPQGWAHQRWW